MQHAAQPATEFDDAAAAAVCRQALELLHTGQGNPQAVIEPVLRARPDVAAAHCLRAASLVMASREDVLPALRSAIERARSRHQEQDSATSN